MLQNRIFVFKFRVGGNNFFSYFTCLLLMCHAVVLMLMNVCKSKQI